MNKRDNPFSLYGKRAFITGGSQGIGAAIAECFALHGADVTIIGRDKNKLEQFQQIMNVQNLTIAAFAYDVTDLKALQALIDSLPAFDILVNNAGTNIPQPFLEVTEANYDRLSQLNVKAAFFCAQYIAKKMVLSPDRKKQGGSIIHISSQMGHVGATNRSVYCTTKHALEGLTKVMAIELAPYNIRVNTLCPTFIETEMTKPFFEDKEFKATVLNKIKLGRLGQVEDVAQSALYLASSASNMMTGSHLIIDGGWSVG